MSDEAALIIGAIINSRLRKWIIDWGYMRDLGMTQGERHWVLVIGKGYFDRTVRQPQKTAFPTLAHR